MIRAIAIVALFFFAGCASNGVTPQQACGARPTEDLVDESASEVAGSGEQIALTRVLNNGTLFHVQARTSPGSGSWLPETNRSLSGISLDELRAAFPGISNAWNVSIQRGLRASINSTEMDSICSVLRTNFPHIPSTSSPTNCLDDAPRIIDASWDGKTARAVIHCNPNMDAQIVVNTLTNIINKKLAAAFPTAT